MGFTVEQRRRNIEGNLYNAIAQRKRNPEDDSAWQKFIDAAVEAYGVNNSHATWETVAIIKELLEQVADIYEVDHLSSKELGPLYRYVARCVMSLRAEEQDQPVGNDLDIQQKIEDHLNQYWKAVNNLIKTQAASVAFDLVSQDPRVDVKKCEQQAYLDINTLLIQYLYHDDSGLRNDKEKPEYNQKLKFHFKEFMKAYHQLD